MTDSDYAQTMDSAYWYDFLTNGDRYSDGGQAEDIDAIANRFLSHDCFRGYQVKIRVRCKYEGGRMFTIQRVYNQKTGKNEYVGDSKDSYAQLQLLHLLKK